MQFREANLHDRPVLAEIYRQCLANADWLPESVKDKAHFDRDTEDELLFVVERDGSVQGFVAVWEPDAFLHHLYVHPDAQGTGVGSLLLNRLREYVPMPWRLKCVQANHRAHGFYLSQGWFEIEAGTSAAGSHWLMECVG